MTLAAAATVRRATTAVRGAATTVISRQGMFITAFVGSVAYVALGIMRLVSLEVVELLCPARGHRSMVAVARIIAIVDVAIKAVGAVEPWAGSNEHPARKPIGSIVAVGRTVIRSIVKVPVRAYRRHSNVDGNLGWGHGCAA
jgi:hypothetical protein